MNCSFLLFLLSLIISIISTVLCKFYMYEREKDKEKENNYFISMCVFFSLFVVIFVFYSYMQLRNYKSISFDKC